MASGGSAGPGPGMFQHKDPFQHDEIQQQRESVAAPEPEPEQPHTNAGDNDVEDGLRLAGVRSHNPFANSSRASQERTQDDNGVNLQLLSSRDQESIDRVVSAHGGGEGLEKVATSSGWADPDAISPGAGAGNHPALSPVAEDGPPILENTNPFDYAPANGPKEGLTNNTVPDRDDDPAVDHHERGTDIFANVDPDWPEGEGPENESPDDSAKDSDSAKRDEEHEGSFVGQDNKPRVAFAVGQDNIIDKAPTHNDDDDDSPGFLDKIKSSAKETLQNFHLLDMKASGPLKGFNPTSVKIRARHGSDSDPNNEVGIIWRSRDNRKGRNSVVIPRTSMAYPNLPSKNRPVYSSSFKGVGRNLFRMMFSFPYWDMAFWSGWSYTWGSVLFVIDGVWSWGPVGWDVKWEVEQNYVVGIFFFVGALLYQVGAVMAYLEAVNDGSFHGSAMKRFLEGKEDHKKKMLDDKIGNFFGHLNPMHEKKRHAEEQAEEKKMSSVDPEAGWRSIHRRERPGSIYPSDKSPGPRRGGVDLGEAEEGESHEYLTWRWWPTWHALRTHHIYEIGYIACSIQLFGATLYSWCGLVSVPGISSEWTANSTFYGGYWFPEIFGSTCFLSASVMFLLETQERWWKPQPNVMGWWIGVWAFIGSWGFLLNGVFGVVAQARPNLDWAEFASECCTTWGSFGYLCSAMCQWYEAVNKHPVEELFNEPGDMKSWQIHPA